jgi:hypothetical protein
MMENGSVAILNVGEGDTKLSFDPEKPVERERAAIIVADMLRRGYAIMITVGEKDGVKTYRRAQAFDPKTCEYLIMGLSSEEEQDIQEQLSGKKKKKRKAYTRVPAHTTTAVAVARSARGCAGAVW